MITTKFTSASTQEDKNFFKKLKLTPPVLGSFGLMLIYGILLLMIGYTQGGFTGITGVDPKHSVLLVLPQSIALIIGTISLKPLMERFNIRTIFLTAYSLLVVVVVLISQLDRITGIKQHQTSINTKGLVTFCVLSFLYGLFISPTSPLTSIFLSTVYTGKGRGAALGISNGFYSLGAGIIPLVASSFVIKEHNTTTTTFADVRTFYYIALGFAVLLLAVACFVSYRHTPASLTTKDMTSGVVSHQDDKMKSGKIYVTALTGIVLMFGVYMVVETFANYAFVSKLGVGVDPFGQDHGLKVTVVQAFGLFLLIQGIWRILSGTVITQFMRYRDFVLMSASLIIAAYIIITVQSRIQKNALLAFFSAVFLGVGLGST